jgi:hypothetical protein
MFAAAVCRRKEIRVFTEMWAFLLKQAEALRRKSEFIPYTSFDSIDFQSCLPFQKMQLLNFCVSLIRTNEQGFAQTEDQFRQSRAFFEVTRDRKYLLECYRTYSSHGMGTLEDFEREYGQELDHPEELPVFDPVIQWEMTFDELKGFLPSEVVGSLVLILLESSLIQLMAKAPQNVVGVKPAIESIQTAFRDWNDEPIGSQVNSLLPHFRHIFFAIALIAILPDERVVSELIEKQRVVLSTAENSELMAKFVKTLDLNPTQKQRALRYRDIELSGFVPPEHGGTLQNLFVAYEPDEWKLKSTVAWTIREMI